MKPSKFINERRDFLKRHMRGLRMEAGLTQEQVAEILECSRTRIVSIEDENTTSEYCPAELELLCAVFGKNPLVDLGTDGQFGIEIGRVLTDLYTSQALGDVVDCELSSKYLKMTKGESFSPWDLSFSPSGHLLVTIIDGSIGEDWWDDEEPYRFTVVAWDTSTGKKLGEFRRIDVHQVQAIDDKRVAVCIEKQKPTGIDRHGKSATHLFHMGNPDGVLNDVFEQSTKIEIWRVDENRVEATLEIVGRVGRMAASPNSQLFAAYIEDTSAAIVYTTDSWSVLHAFEFERPDKTQGRFSYAKNIEDLPYLRKRGASGFSFGVNRFDFRTSDVLVIGLQEKLHEFSMSNPDVWIVPNYGIRHSSIQHKPLIHDRNEMREIFVSGLERIFDLNCTLAEIGYSIPGSDSWDNSFTVDKVVMGFVHSPRILNEHAVVGLVEYRSQYPWGMINKPLIGLVNLISGHVVMLTDNGRIRDGDVQTSETFSEAGDLVAYWVLPEHGDARLSVQKVNSWALCRDNISLIKQWEAWRETEKRRI
jgi:DNA-binding XRE family transcriptional regulator